MLTVGRNLTTGTIHKLIYQITILHHKEYSLIILPRRKPTTDIDISDSYTKGEIDAFVSGAYKTVKLATNGGVGGWYYIGDFIANGVDFINGNPIEFKAGLKLEFVGHSYYNDSNANQDSIIVLRFKSGSQSSGTFLGNAQAYKLGKQQHSPEELRIVQDSSASMIFRFYASYRPFAEGSFVTAASSKPFIFDGSFSTTAPTGNYITVPIYDIYTSESGVPISGVTNLTSALAAKADYNATALPTFHNKQDVEQLLGSYYTTTQVDSSIDQKFTFSNPGTEQLERWIKLGSITYPTSLLSDRLYSVMRIYFTENVLNANDDFYMTVLFKFSSLPLGGSDPTSIGNVTYPMYASCEYSIHSKTTKIIILR